MLLNEAIKPENNDKVYFGKINELNQRLNDYNLGGIPLPLIVLCYKITTSNCYTISKLILEACPDFMFIEGEVESMKTAGDCNGMIKNSTKGYHVWLEKDNFVYDPVLALFFDKDFYYEHEKAVVRSRKTLEEVSATSKYNKAFIPKKKIPSSIFSKYRLLIILEAMKPFIEQDNWIYSKPLQEEFSDLYNQFDKEGIKTQIKTIFPNLNKETFSEIYNELTTNKKYDEDGFQQSQTAFLALLGRQMRELTSINKLNLKPKTATEEEMKN